jgi:hypothetical protein
VHYLDFDRHLIGQHNEELLREVRAHRLARRLRTNNRVRSGRSGTLNLPWWRSVLSLVGGAASSE